MKLNTTLAAVEAFLFLAISTATISNDELLHGYTPNLHSSIPLVEGTHDARVQGHTHGKSRAMHMRSVKSDHMAARTSADGTIVAVDAGATEIRGNHARSINHKVSDRRAARTTADGAIVAVDVGATELGNNHARSMRRVRSDRRSVRSSAVLAHVVDDRGTLNEDKEERGAAMGAMVFKYALLGVKAGTSAKKIVEHIKKAREFEDLAKQSVSQMDSLLQNASSGHWHSSEALRSNYLQLVRLREDLASIKTFCEQPRGMHRLMWWNFPKKNVTELITKRVKLYDEVLSSVKEYTFCDSFETWATKMMATSDKIIIAWEHRTKKTWAPKRTKLSWRPPFISRLPDTLKADPDVHHDTKFAHTHCIDEIRLLLKEMSSISPNCRKKALQLPSKSHLCKRCPTCCEMPSDEPGLFDRVIEKVRNKTGTDRAKVMIATAKDLKTIGVGTAKAVKGTINPAMIMYLAVRVGTAQNRREPCNAAAELLDNHELPEGEAGEMDKLDQSALPAQDVDVSLELPEPEIKASSPASAGAPSSPAASPSVEASRRRVFR